MMGKTWVKLAVVIASDLTPRLAVAPPGQEVVCAGGGTWNWKNLKQMNSSSEEFSDEATAKSKNIRWPSCPI